MSETTRDLLAAPCVFCGYNGSGYWSPETHEDHCPWYHLGGEDNRVERLRAVVGKLRRRAGPIEPPPPIKGNAVIRTVPVYGAPSPPSDIDELLFESERKPKDLVISTTTPHLDRWMLDGGRAVLLERDGNAGFVASAVVSTNSGDDMLSCYAINEKAEDTKGHALMELDLLLKRQAEELLGLRAHECEQRKE